MIDEIIVYKGTRGVRIDSYSNFFSDCEYFVFKNDGEKLIISKERLDTTKQSLKVIKRYNCYRFGVILDIPLGKHTICEEESNEDMAVIYYQN